MPTDRIIRLSIAPATATHCHDGTDRIGRGICPLHSSRSRRAVCLAFNQEIEQGNWDPKRLPDCIAAEVPHD